MPSSTIAFRFFVVDPQAWPEVLNFDLHGSVPNADQFHAGIELAQARTHVLERLKHTRLKVIGMQGIEQKQIADQRILSNLAISASPVIPASPLRLRFQRRSP